MRITEEAVDQELLENIHGCANDAANMLEVDRQQMTAGELIARVDDFIHRWQKGERIEIHEDDDLSLTVCDPRNSTIVIFDLPPLLETDDFLAFSPLADAVMLVVAEGETKQTDLHRSAEMISNLDILGIVLNKSRGDEYPAGYYP